MVDDTKEREDDYVTIAVIIIKCRTNRLDGYRLKWNQKIEEKN